MKRHAVIKNSMEEMIITEGDYTVKTLTTHEERDAAYRLRHDVFVDELSWVKPSIDGREIDAYDRFAVPIGIFGMDGQILGHVRMIASPYPYMIEKEFKCLMPSDKNFVKKPFMTEGTRTCIKKEARGDTHFSMTLANLLYKGIYCWSLLNGLTAMVTIVEYKYYVLLKRNRFPFEKSGEFKPLGAGVMSGIIQIDWARVETELQFTRPAFYQWLVRKQAPLHMQSPLHDACLQH